MRIDGHRLIGAGERTVSFKPTQNIGGLVDAGPLTQQEASWVSAGGRTHPDAEVLVAAHKFDTVVRGWPHYPGPSS